MENQVPSDVAHRRSAILIADGKVRKQRFEEKISETVTKVLFEESVTIDGKVYASGHTMEYIRMLMETTENLERQEKNAVRTVCCAQKLGPEQRIVFKAIIKITRRSINYKKQLNFSDSYIRIEV